MGKSICTSFNDGNPMVHCKHALVTVTVGLGWTLGLYNGLRALGVSRETDSQRWSDDRRVWRLPGDQCGVWRHADALDYCVPSDLRKVELCTDLL